jgi:hypothetical protein
VEEVLDDSQFPFYSVTNSNQTAVAVDSAGHVAVSVPVITSSGSRGVWNYLSRGDFSVLIPGGSADASYSPIGVLD